jgi:glutamate-5-semialdehyde dehydrogenase
MTPFKAIKEASLALNALPAETLNEILIHLAKNFRIDRILEANRQDLAKMEQTHPLYDRLLLTKPRMEALLNDLIRVSQLPSPLNRILEHRTLQNGLDLQKVSVPLGVVGVIDEARPNVTLDVFSLCLKSGNASILKGGSDAFHSNEAIMEEIHRTLHHFHLPKEIAYLMPPDRKSVDELLNAARLVDVIIPRGSEQLIQYVREHAKVPVIETGAGIVHTYLDHSFDLNQAKKIIHNAKTRRVSVCNALDTLIVHQDSLSLLPQVLEPLIEKKVLLYADAPAYQALKGRYPFLEQEERYGTEFLDYKMSIKTVKNLSEALEHIHTYSSKHSEAILSNQPENIERFLKAVDAAAVYANASTAFTDGGEFGLGAEIGISTQKLHARGPMGLTELTSYKWIIQGEGQIR